MTDELNLSAWVARRAEQDTLQSHADYIVESIKELEDTIQEERLCKWELLESPWKERALAAEAKLSKSEALLAKALEGFEKLARLGNGDRYGNSDGNVVAQKYIAELTGGDND